MKIINDLGSSQWAKSPKKQFLGVDNIALYFECRINKKASPSDCFFADFAHWDCTFPIR